MPDQHPGSVVVREGGTEPIARGRLRQGSPFEPGRRGPDAKSVAMYPAICEWIERGEGSAKVDGRRVAGDLVVG